MTDDKKTLKFQMMMAPAEAEVLDDWMFRNRVRSRAEAIRRLWQMALDLDEDLPAIHNRLESLLDGAIELVKAVTILTRTDLYRTASAEQKQLIDDIYKRAVSLSQAAYLSDLDVIEINNRSMPFATKRSVSAAKKAAQMNVEEIREARFAFQTMVENDYASRVAREMSEEEWAAFQDLPFEERQERMNKLCEDLLNREIAAGKISKPKVG